MLAFDYWFSYDDLGPRVWCGILNFEVDRKVYFNNIYDCMLTKNESDLIWKIRHGAIPTVRFMYGCRYSDSPNCHYCGELEDLTHIFVTCSRLSGFIFIYLIFKDSSIFCIVIYNILFFNIFRTKQYHNMLCLCTVI